VATVTYLLLAKELVECDCESQPLIARTTWISIRIGYVETETDRAMPPTTR